MVFFPLTSYSVLSAVHSTLQQKACTREKLIPGNIKNWQNRKNANGMYIRVL